MAQIPQEHSKCNRKMTLGFKGLKVLKSDNDKSKRKQHVHNSKHSG